MIASENTLCNLTFIKAFRLVLLFVVNELRLFKLLPKICEQFASYRKGLVILPDPIDPVVGETASISCNWLIS